MGQCTVNSLQVCVNLHVPKGNDYHSKIEIQTLTICKIDYSDL